MEMEGNDATACEVLAQNRKDARDGVRSVSHDDAKEIARRLIAGSFRRDGERLGGGRRPQFSIPCRPDHDDYCLILAYIEQRICEATGVRSRISDLIEANNRYQQEARDGRATVKRLEGERDRSNRNRDMWQGQCDRQAATLETLRRNVIETYYARQIEWSRETFGPAKRTKGVIEHIRKELREIEAEPDDLSEWVDVIILAMDGFWRHGGTPEALMPALLAKQEKNMARAWPDWRTMSEDDAIEHDRSADPRSTLAKEAGRGE